MSVINYGKLHAKLNQMLELNDLEGLDIFDLNEDISNKILNHQYVHICSLIDCLKKNYVALDGSDPGTGKTYTAMAITKQLRKKALIICTKTMISFWIKIAKIFNVELLSVINYESVKSNNCKYIVADDNGNYTWNLPKYSIVIFDEVHKCKNITSQNGKLLLSSKNNRKFHILMLSATIADKSKDFAIFGYMLGFYNNISGAKSWINTMIRRDKYKMNNKSSIYDEIYPNKGSRMCITELGEDFPKNIITFDSYTLEDNKLKEVNRLFEKIEKGDQIIKSNNTIDGCILGEITNSRIKIEKYKIPIVLDLMEDYLVKGFSIVIFVNYKETLYELQKHIKDSLIIEGSIEKDVIDKHILLFQENKCRVIICTISMASVGISLHDLHGVPRISLIMPIHSAVNYEQLIGRTYRVGIKTPAIQKVIFIANTCEEVICNQMKNKITFMNKINKEII